MMRKNIKLIQQSFISGGVLLLFSSLSLPADIHIGGKVVSLDNGAPLDSVRVTSSSLKTATYTDSTGAFSLSLIKIDCHQDTEVVEAYDEYSISVDFADRHYSYESFEKKPFKAVLTDLRGREIAKTEKWNQKVSVLFDSPIIPGTYILQVAGHTPKKVIITHHQRGSFKVQKRRVQILNVPDCSTIDDTIFFCKRGYLSAALPIKDIDNQKPVTLIKKSWVAFDCHNHTFLTDGGFPFDSVCTHAFNEGGLDILVNSEHGGRFTRDTAGMGIIDNPWHAENAPRVLGSDYIPRWYSLKYFSWPKILSMRKRYPEKIILQGLEWNVPGHEHASVGFINDGDQPDAVAEFEYRFDEFDPDTSIPLLGKDNSRLHKSGLAAVTWLKNNYPQSSYFFINHPSRENSGQYTVSDFRDFNSLAPEVNFAFEGMPGHQKNVMRGSYTSGGSTRNRTWGGADHIVAKVGGIWDALLGEGRRIWIIVNSDFHVTSNDFWPGEYPKTWSIVTDTGAQAWLDGMRTGEMFIAHGDLINRLEFTIDDGVCSVNMGADMRSRSSTLSLEIRFASPPKNCNNDIPKVDHLDLISGKITGMVYPGNFVAYNNPENRTTRVVKQFSSKNWVSTDEWTIIRDTLSCNNPTYFRLRGTNLPVNTPGETDEEGNPHVDPDYQNSEAKAWSDLWFYSNPIFVYPR